MVDAIHGGFVLMFPKGAALWNLPLPSSVFIPCCTSEQKKSTVYYANPVCPSLSTSNFYLTRTPGSFGFLKPTSLPFLPLQEFKGSKNHLISQTRFHTATSLCQRPRLKPALPETRRRATHAHPPISFLEKQKKARPCVGKCCWLCGGQNDKFMLKMFCSG